jgi:hypothetical protein
MYFLLGDCRRKQLGKQLNLAFLSESWSFPEACFSALRRMDVPIVSLIFGQILQALTISHSPCVIF